MRTGSVVLFCCGALAGLATFSGCSHYRWGVAPGELRFSTLYVEPIQNRTMLPQAQVPIENQLRTAFLEDGRVRLVDSPGEAEAVLRVVMTRFHREVAAVRQQDAGLASKFAETLEAQCTLTDARTGKVYFRDRPVKVERGVFTDNGNPHSSLIGDQLQAEYNTVPLLAESLAHEISHAVLDVW